MISPVTDNSKLFQALYNKNLNTLNDVMKRLASGRRINSGKDDPAGLIAATQLEAAIASLEAESRAIQRTNANANIADGHLSQLSEMSADLQGLVVASANTAGMSDAEIAANQMEIDALSSSIQRFAQDAISSLDRISLPDEGNEALATQLRDAAVAVASLASGGANELSSGNAEAAQAAVDQAATAFAEARGTIGAYQKYDLETRQNSLAIEHENLLAAHSQIVDADYAQETSNLARAKVLTAASAMVLRIANNNAERTLDLLV